MSDRVTATGIASGPEPLAPARALSAWPAVTHGPVRFSLPATATQTLRIFDRAGRQVGTVPTAGGSVVSIDLSGLAPGVYFARVTSEDDRFLTGTVTVVK